MKAIASGAGRRWGENYLRHSYHDQGNRKFHLQLASNIEHAFCVSAVTVSKKATYRREASVPCVCQGASSNIIWVNWEHVEVEGFRKLAANSL